MYTKSLTKDGNDQNKLSILNEFMNIISKPQGQN